MKAYVFFSVHELLFQSIEERLVSYGVTEHSGFVWGENQRQFLSQGPLAYSPLIVFSRDLLPKADDGDPDIEWLARREQELGVSLQRMLAAERHLWKGRSYAQILRLAEVILRGVADALDAAAPDFVWSEDVSCFTSYAHFVIARERGIPFWCIGGARLPRRVSIYSSGFQRSERMLSRFEELRRSGMSTTQREQAQQYVEAFMERPHRPPGMERRAEVPTIGRADGGRFLQVLQQYRADPRNPTVMRPGTVVANRLRRIVRTRISQVLGHFEVPEPGERYVIYPIHFQPEASTLIQAPMYLDQVHLIQDIARSLPIGYRLYVKEHVSNRGRRPASFYEAIQAIPSVRLLGPDVDTWELIRGASAIAVITGTMGWEGLLFGKPVISFGSVWYNALPHVYRGDRTPRDDLYGLFHRALTSHQADHEALLAMITAMHESSYAGAIHNPRTFPHVLEDPNVESLTKALAESAIAPS